MVSVQEAPLSRETNATAWCPFGMSPFHEEQVAVGLSQVPSCSSRMGWQGSSVPSRGKRVATGVAQEWPASRLVLVQKPIAV